MLFGKLIQKQEQGKNNLSPQNLVKNNNTQPEPKITGSYIKKNV